MIINNVFCTNPIEQFLVFPLVLVKFFSFNFSLLNSTIFLFLVFIFLTISLYSIIPTDTDIQKGIDELTLYAIPSRFQRFFELIILTILMILNDNVKSKKGIKYFPIIFSSSLFLFCLNLIGLIPYSFTLTSHLVITFSIALILFIGINLICFSTHGLKFFGLFLPPKTQIELAFLLVPIELISYIFKPISLAMRLFSNMMAGHTLLKVIAGFGFNLLKYSGFLFFLHFFPLFILIPLVVLETAVAVIQSIVFTLLICIFLNDALNLH